LADECARAATCLSSWVLLSTDYPSRTPSILGMPTLKRLEPFAKPFVAVPDFEQTEIGLLPASYGQRTKSSMHASLSVSYCRPCTLPWHSYANLQRPCRAHRPGPAPSAGLASHHGIECCRRNAAIWDAPVQSQTSGQLAGCKRAARMHVDVDTSDATLLQPNEKLPTLQH
jgi:hypothetical protein